MFHMQQSSSSSTDVSTRVVCPMRKSPFFCFFSWALLLYLYPFITYLVLYTIPYLVRFQVLTAVSMKMPVFWVVVLCSLVEVY
jgi:hypothetical protein